MIFTLPVVHKRFIVVPYGHEIDAVTMSFCGAGRCWTTKFVDVTRPTVQNTAVVAVQFICRPRLGEAIYVFWDSGPQQWLCRPRMSVAICRPRVSVAKYYVDSMRWLRSLILAGCTLDVLIDYWIPHAQAHITLRKSMHQWKHEEGKRIRNDE